MSAESGRYTRLGAIPSRVRSRHLGVMTLAVGITVAVTVIGLTHFGARNHDTFRPRMVAPLIPPGVVVTRSPEAVEKRVRAGLGRDAQIQSIRAVSSRRELSRFIPSLGAFAAKEKGGPVWIVRAHGAFRRVTDQPGQRALTGQRNGYVVVDDATGTVIAYGW